MCLHIYKDYRRDPILNKPCFKFLTYQGRGRWATPYFYSDKIFTIDDVGSGWFVPIDLGKYEKTRMLINGGLLHSRTKPQSWCKPVTNREQAFYKGNDYIFPGVAWNVRAIGENDDMVSDYIYLPFFDKRK